MWKTRPGRAKYATEARAQVLAWSRATWHCGMFALFGASFDSYPAPTVILGKLFNDFLDDSEDVVYTSLFAT